MIRFVGIYQCNGSEQGQHLFLNFFNLSVRTPERLHLLCTVLAAVVIVSASSTRKKLLHAKSQWSAVCGTERAQHLPKARKRRLTLADRRSLQVHHCRH
jgi:hypothetical protein